MNVPLLLNHFIILYNIFGDAATPLLFYRIDSELWNILKTFIVYLDRLPPYPISQIHNIQIDSNCMDILDNL